MVKVVGLTGGIASGKSTVTRYLQSLGYLVLDSDLYSKEALDDPKLIQEVLSRHDVSCLDGTIDRKKLGNIIFSDKKEKAWLESLIHPYVIHRLKQGVDKNQDKDILFLDIPLLYEAKLEYLCDEIIVVYVNKQTQLKRLIERNHYTNEEAWLRIDNQLSLELKKDKADIVFDNNFSIESLYNQIDDYLRKENL